MSSEYKSSLETVVCASCGVVFAIDEAFKSFKQRDGTPFHCPNGHPNIFSDNTRKNLDRATARITELENELEETKVENRRLKCELLKLAPTEEGKKTLLQRLGLT